VAPKIIEKILRSGRNPAEPESVVESAWYLAGAVAER